MKSRNDEVLCSWGSGGKTGSQKKKMFVKKIVAFSFALKIQQSASPCVCFAMNNGHSRFVPE